jgi:hypothetical protein
MEMPIELSPHVGIGVGGVVRYGRDASLDVTFYDRDVYVDEVKDINTGEVLKEARMKKVLYCRIESPGDKQSVWDQPAREKDKARFQVQYQQFLKGSDPHTGGTPLAELPNIAKDQLQALRGFHLYSVEQAAAMSDAQISGLGIGGREIKKRAEAFLVEKATISRAKEAQKIADENAELRALVEKQGALLEKLAAAHEAKSEPAPEVTEQPQPKKNAKKEVV